MTAAIKSVSCLIILLGLIHITFAFPLQSNTDTLWFVGAGFAIIFAGLINLLSLDRGGSLFTKTVALLVNMIGCGGFWIALPILDQPQVYVGISIFLLTSLGFIILLIKRQPVRK